MQEVVQLPMEQCLNQRNLVFQASQGEVEKNLKRKKQVAPEKLVQEAKDFSALSPSKQRRTGVGQCSRHDRKNSDTRTHGSRRCNESRGKGVTSLNPEQWDQWKDRFLTRMIQ